MLLTVSIVLGYKNEIVRKITGLTADIVVSSINLNASNEPEAIQISEDSLQLLRQLPNISHIQRTAFKNGLLKTKYENEGVLLKGIDKNYDTTFIKTHLSAGRLLRFNDASASKEVVMSSELSKVLNINVGDKITVYFLVQRQMLDSTTGEAYQMSVPLSRPLTICGIFTTGFSDFDKQLGIVDLRMIQVLNGWSLSSCGSYEIKLTGFERLNESTESVQAYLGYNYSTRAVTEIYSTIFVWLDKLDINGIIVVVLMIVVATINMITALLILMLERANMVGMVKALGMSNVSVRSIFLRISFRLVGKGMLWGNIIGISLCLIQYYFRVIELDATSYYVDHVAIQINWLYILVLNVGTLLSCGLMLLLPTLILTGMTPLKTLKFD